MPGFSDAVELAYNSPSFQLSVPSPLTLNVPFVPTTLCLFLTIQNGNLALFRRTMQQSRAIMHDKEGVQARTRAKPREDRIPKSSWNAPVKALLFAINTASSSAC